MDSPLEGTRFELPVPLREPWHLALTKPAGGQPRHFCYAWFEPIATEAVVRVIELADWSLTGVKLRLRRNARTERNRQNVRGANGPRRFALVVSGSRRGRTISRLPRRSRGPAMGVRWRSRVDRVQAVPPAAPGSQKAAPGAPATP